MTRESPKLKVIVVGAGIGGIACAVECKRKGCDVSIYDAAQSFARLGDTIGLYFLAYRYSQADSPTVRNLSIDGLQTWIAN
jgi:2-polyprenyl-6-methoxyphenol hydroxylase-like FAD-dependent oxidoreductase